MDKDSQLIEESFKRIESKEGIIGTIVVNNEGMYSLFPHTECCQ